jgi:hypothetical protein
MDKNENKAKEWFVNNIIYIIVALISAVFLFSAIFEISETGKTLEEILLNSALILVIGYVITVLLDIQGIFKGGKTEEVIKIKQSHEKVVELAEPYAKDLDTFCEQENISNLRQARTRILAKAGLNYDECFNENGSAKEVKFERVEKPKKDKKKTKSENALIFKEYKEKLSNIKYKKKMFKQAVRVRLTQLTTQDLISNGANKYDKFDLGDTQKDYLKKSWIGSILSKVAVALIFGYYTIQLISDFSWAVLLWTALQVVTFLAFGIIKYFQAYMFMQNQFVDRTKRQISELKKFLAEKGEIKPLDESDLIEKITREVEKKFEIVE